MQEDRRSIDELLHVRVRESVLATVIDIVMPPDPKPMFMWPHFVATTHRRYFKGYYLHLIAASLLIITVGLVILLHRIPLLQESVLSVLTAILEQILPSSWATAIAILYGVTIMVLFGSFIHTTPLQRALDEIPIQTSVVYRFLLWAALREEQLFRSGSERWSWLQKIQASLAFGVAHIVNIWYSFAAGIALSVTGFGFLLVYTYYYRKTHSQAIATSASTIVHAMYNTIALVALVVALAFWLIEQLTTGL